MLIAECVLDRDSTDTALHLAVRCGNQKAVELLLSANADLCLSGTNEEPLIIVAAQNCAKNLACTNIFFAIFESHLQQQNYSVVSMLEILKRYTANEHDHGNMIKKALRIFFKVNEYRKLDRTHERVFGEYLRAYMANNDYELFDKFLQVGVRPGRGALHYLVKHSVEEPQRIEEIRNVYTSIVKHSVHISFSDTEKQRLTVSGFQQRRMSMMKLLNGRFSMTEDSRECNVMEYACSIGAVEMIDTILNTEGVIKLESSAHRDKYDATNLVPDTMNDSVSNSQVFVGSDPQAAHLESPTGRSFLQMLIDSSESANTDRDIAQLLDKEPFRTLAWKYKMNYFIIVSYFLFIHLFYMGIFTWNSTLIEEPVQINSTELYHNECISADWRDFRFNQVPKEPQFLFYLVWFVWPLFVSCIEVLEFIISFLELRRRLSAYIRTEKKRKHGFDLTSVLVKVASTLMPSMSSLLNMMFVGVAFTWLAILFSPGCIPGALFFRIMAAVLVIGWINTLNYCYILLPTSWNNLICMLKRIFTDDLPKFVVIYSLFYVGFGFSNKIFQFLLANSHPGSGSPSIIFPLIFGMAGSALDSESVYNIDSDFSVEKGCMFVYFGITFLVLSNLFIAMINQSYAEINKFSRLETQYMRFRWIKKGLFLRKLCRYRWKNYPYANIQTSLNEFGNYEIWITKSKNSKEENESNLSQSEIMKLNIEQIMKKTGQMDNMMNQMNNRIIELSKMIRPLKENNNEHFQEIIAKKQRKKFARILSTSKWILEVFF